MCVCCCGRKCLCWCSSCVTASTSSVWLGGTLPKTPNLPVSVLLRHCRVRSCCCCCCNCYWLVRLYTCYVAYITTLDIHSFIRYYKHSARTHTYKHIHIHACYLAHSQPCSLIAVTPALARVKCCSLAVLFAVVLVVVVCCLPLWSLLQLCLSQFI